MKTLIALLLALTVSSAAHADRPFPSGMQLGTLGSYSGNSVGFTPRTSSLVGWVVGLVTPGGAYPTSPALRIYDRDNHLVLTGQLSNYSGSPVGVTFDFQGNINRIWVLTSQELATLTQ